MHSELPNFINQQAVILFFIYSITLFQLEEYLIQFNYKVLFYSTKIIGRCSECHKQFFISSNYYVIPWIILILQKIPTKQ